VMGGHIRHATVKNSEHSPHKATPELLHNVIDGNTKRPRVG
jgi:hypothetical protein